MPDEAERKRGDLSERRTAAASTLRELRIELEYRRSELAALERAHDVLERQVEEHIDRCDRYHPDNPCAGELYSRFCRICGIVVKRCQEHGGIRAATYAADAHRSEAHGGQHARLTETDDEGRLRSGSATVSMGGMPAPSTARDRAEPRNRPQHAVGQAPRPQAYLAADEPAEPRARHPGSEAGVGVYRRAPAGPTLDR